MKDLAKRLKTMRPQLIADVRLYTTAAGGRLGPIAPGYGCPCIPAGTSDGWDARLMLDETWMHPGETRRLGFVFLSPDGARAIREARKFHLWEGRNIGEGVVVEGDE